jgi:hypothetical protein
MVTAGTTDAATLDKANADAAALQAKADEIETLMKERDSLKISNTLLEKSKAEKVAQLKEDKVDSMQRQEDANRATCDNIRAENQAARERMQNEKNESKMMNDKALKDLALRIDALHAQQAPTAATTTIIGPGTNRQLADATKDVKNIIGNLGKFPANDHLKFHGIWNSMAVKLKRYHDDASTLVHFPFCAEKINADPTSQLFAAYLHDECFTQTVKTEVTQHFGDAYANTTLYQQLDFLYRRYHPASERNINKLREELVDLKLANFSTKAVATFLQKCSLYYYVLLDPSSGVTMAKQTLIQMFIAAVPATLFSLQLLKMRDHRYRSETVCHSLLNTSGYEVIQQVQMQDRELFYTYESFQMQIKAIEELQLAFPNVVAELATSTGTAYTTVKTSGGSTKHGTAGNQKSDETAVATPTICTYCKYYGLKSIMLRPGQRPPHATKDCTVKCRKGCMMAGTNTPCFIQACYHGNKGIAGAAVAAGLKEKSEAESRVFITETVKETVKSVMTALASTATSSTE